MEGKYNPSEIEAKWQKKWLELGIYKDYSREKKFYALDMFPYPSGSGLHVGHPKGYIATDVVSRFKMLQGFSVLHPMGWDAFGLPAENYAIKNKVHPKVAVEKNVATFKAQLQKFGFTYDWDREINTTDPEYYKWTQWIFLKMFEKGLAYESEEPVNWCPNCKTVLANEDLENGNCERCGGQIVQRKLRQWVLKMTDYADRLLYDLDKEDLNWEELIKEQQRNWIGRSEGAEIKFKLVDNEKFIEVFTTRIDTIFSGTYLILAPDHKLVDEITTSEQKKAVEEYILKTSRKTEMERTELQKDKTGVFTGAYAINPATGEKIQVWISDFVLANYGTGAVFADAHDERDFEMAKKYNIPLKVSIRPSDEKLWEQIKNLEVCFSEEGILVNSEQFDGLSSAEAKPKIISWLEEKNLAKKRINYKMRDWVFSRQRYWGEPIPIVHCESCGAVALPESELPLKLPEVESYEPTDNGESPLANIAEWVNVKCPKCGGEAKRETNTMPQWAGSCWYYLRYIDNKNDKALVDKAKEKKWMPVDLYVGGAEHATRHLLYARFWHKFLFDIGVVSTTEPFKKLMHVGLINAEDGRKMSKRWNNVVNPDDVISEFGADAMRLYEMFMGPFVQNIAWSTAGVKGTRVFLDKIYNFSVEMMRDGNEYLSEWVREYESGRKFFVGEAEQEMGDTDPKIKNLLHKTIKKVGEDIENFRFNTAVSQLMIFLNSFYRAYENEKGLNIVEINGFLRGCDFKKFLIILSPFVPHLAEELWEKLGNKNSIFLENWPEYDKNLIKDEEFELIVQISGKVRDKIKVKMDISEDEAKEIAMQSEKIKNLISGKEIKKIIFVKNRLINIVV